MQFVEFLEQKVSLKINFTGFIDLGKFTSKNLIDLSLISQLLTGFSELIHGGQIEGWLAHNEVRRCKPLFH